MSDLRTSFRFPGGMCYEFRISHEGCLPSTQKMHCPSSTRIPKYPWVCSKKKKTKQFECIQIYRSWFIACFAHHLFGSVAHSHPPQSPNCANHIHFYLKLSFTSYFSRNLLHSLANTIYFTLCIKISFNVMSYLCKCRICADRTHKNICMTNIICFWFMCVEYNWGVLVLLLFRWNLSHIHNTWMVDATHI